MEGTIRQGELGRADLAPSELATLEEAGRILELRFGFEAPAELGIRFEVLFQGGAFQRAYAHLGPLRRGRLDERPGGANVGLS